MNAKETTELPATLGVGSTPVVGRFRVEKRIGIVAVYDLEHPQYNPDWQGCHSDLPWVVATWTGYDDPKEGWCLYDFQVQKANELCAMLNALATMRKD